MEQFHLIIQKTTTGLLTEFSSPGIDPKHPNVVSTLEDERAYVTQVVKDSDVYSIQITPHYRIYSLIVIDIDIFGRSGFYEFKLYGPREYSLVNFDAILQEIKEIYNQDTSNKPYESILSAILLTPNNRLADFIPVKSNNKKYYSFYDEINLDSLKEVFIDKGVYLISKLYVLNRSKAYEENVIHSVGLLPFSMGQYREVVITDPYHVLKELFLNNEKLEFNNFREEVKILLEPIDILSYSTLDSKNIKRITGSFVQVEKKQLVSQPVSPHSPKPKKKSFLAENAVYLLALVIMIGGAVIGFPQYKHFLGFKTTEDASFISQPLNSTQTPIIEQDSTQIFFHKIVDGDQEHYRTEYPLLAHYIFTYSNNQWKFINCDSKRSYQDFNRGIVKKLNIDQKTFLNEEEQEKFIFALEEISEKKIETPEEIKDTSEAVNLSNRNNINKRENKVDPKSDSEANKETKKSLLNTVMDDLKKTDH